jgi:hypothetical protein
VVNVYLGAHNFSAPSEVNRKQYWGNETFIHPNWNRTTKAGDIALVKLSTVVEYTSKTKSNQILKRISKNLTVETLMQNTSIPSACQIHPNLITSTNTSPLQYCLDYSLIVKYISIIIPFI